MEWADSVTGKPQAELLYCFIYWQIKTFDKCFFCAIVDNGVRKKFEYDRERKSMKRKFLALFLTAAMALSVAACGSDDGGKADAPAASTAAAGEEAELPEAEEEEAPEVQEDIDPMEEALKNMESVTSMEMKMVMDMDMKVSAEGEEQTVESSTTMDMVWVNDPVKVKAEVAVEAAGQSTEMSVYGEMEEDGTYMMYIYDGTSWQSQTVGKADLGEFDARENMVASIGDGSAYTAEGTEQVDGANAYKYSYVMTGDEMKEAMLSSGALDSVTSLGIDSTQLDGMLDGLGEITTYVWIDEATLYPVKYQMDMTEVMDQLMVNLVEAMGEQAQGMTMNVPKLEVTMTCFNYNNVADFSVPEEAKAN